MATTRVKPDVAEVQDQAEVCRDDNSTNTYAGKSVHDESPFAGGAAQQAGHVKGTSSFGSRTQPQGSSSFSVIQGQKTPSQEAPSPVFASCSTCIAGNSSADPAAQITPAAKTMQQAQQQQQQSQHQQGDGLPSASSSRSDPTGSVSTAGMSNTSAANSVDALLFSLSAVAVSSSSGGTSAAAGQVNGTTETAVTATGATPGVTGVPTAHHTDGGGGGAEAGSSAAAAEVGKSMSNLQLRDADAGVTAEPAGPEGQAAAGVEVQGTGLGEQPPTGSDQQQQEQEQGQEGHEQLEQGQEEQEQQGQGQGQERQQEAHGLLEQGQEEQEQQQQQQGQGQAQEQEQDVAVDQGDAGQVPGAGKQQQQQQPPAAQPPAAQPPQPDQLGNFYSFWFANMAPAAPAALPAPPPDPIAAPLEVMNQPGQQEAAAASEEEPFQDDYAGLAAAFPHNAQQQQQQQAVFPEHIPVARVAPEDGTVTFLGIALGTGSFGSVQLAMYRGDWVAVKLLQDTQEWGVVWTDDLRRSKLAEEVKLLERAKRYNPRVVGVRAVITQPGYYGIIMEACDSGLFNRIQDWQTRDQAAPMLQGWHPEPSWPVLQSLLREAAQTLWDLHSRGIIHNDLRAANFLLKAGLRGWELRLCDFGLAKVDEGPATGGAAAGPAGTAGAAAAGAAAGDAAGAAVGAAGYAPADGAVAGGAAGDAAGAAAGQAQPGAPAGGPRPSARARQVTNHLWRAPELFADEEQWYTVTGPTDMYALGCTFEEMMIGRVIPPLFWHPPLVFPEKQVADPALWHRALPQPMPDLLPTEVQRCFRADPALRPTAQHLAEALPQQQQQQHPLLAQLGLAVAG